MGRRVRRSTGAGGTPPGFLGPTGPHAVVTLSDEAANDRFSRRCEPLGISVAELMSRARVPNAGRPDRPDPDEPDNPSKFHRFEKLTGTRVQGRRFKLVCVTEEAADADLPGRIHIVTMVDLG